MIVAPAMVDVSLAMPPVATARSDGRIDVMLGAVHVSVPPMPGAPVYAEGLEGTFSATLRGTVSGDGAGTEATFGDIEIVELAVATESPLSGPDRENTEMLFGLLAWHLGSFALNDGGPALPVASMETTADFVPYGLTAGTVLGTVSRSSSPSTAPHRQRLLRRDRRARDVIRVSSCRRPARDRRRDELGHGSIHGSSAPCTRTRRSSRMRTVSSSTIGEFESVRRPTRTPVSAGTTSGMYICERRSFADWFSK